MLKSKNLESKSNFKINYASFILIYLVYSSIFVFLNTYFPILFFNVLDVNRFILALIQFLAYSILLLRPVFAAITDKYRIKGYQRKYYILFSGYFLMLFYFFMGLTFNNIFIFGFILCLIFISITMLDVSTKSLIIDVSPTNEIKKRAFFFIMVGISLGSAFPFLLYTLLVNDVYSIQSWTTFFICSYLILSPLLFILPFITESRKSDLHLVDHIENSYIYEVNNEKFEPHFKKTFILLSLFVFFAFSDIIFSYPFFPFIINKFGNSNFNLLNFFLIFMFLLNILSSAIGTFSIKKTSPKKIIIILIPIIGIIYFSYTFVDFTLFVLLYFLGSSLAIITNLNISVFIMKFIKENKTLHFHIITTFKNLSFCCFIPLGIFLSNFINIELLIITGAILLNISLIPLYFIKF